MEYFPLAKSPYYEECSNAVNGMGCQLLDLKICPTKATTKVFATIKSVANKSLPIDEVSKVHRVLQSRLEALLASDGSEKDIYMEVSTPGTDRNIRNAAEFAFFAGVNVRLYLRTKSDWVIGTIKSSSEKDVTIITAENDMTVQYEDIAKAKLA